MPASVYKLISKDTDYMKLASSSKLEIETYTTDKIKVIVSCTPPEVDPDTQCLQEVTFHVSSHEGSFVLSCVTTLELSLIPPCNNLDYIPSSASLILTNADYPSKNKFQTTMKVSKLSKMCVQARNNLP